MRPPRILTLALLLTLAASARAQYPEPAGPRRPEVALVISLAATAGPLLLANVAHRSGTSSSTLDGLAITGVVFGPATGYWYARSPEWKRGVITRVVLTTGTLLLWDNAVYHCHGECLGEGLAAFFLGMAALGSAAYDIGHLHAAVDRANGGGTDLSILPGYSPSTRQFALTAHLSF